MVDAQEIDYVQLSFGRALEMKRRCVKQRYSIVLATSNGTESRTPCVFWERELFSRTHVG